MTIAESRSYIERITQWAVHEETFQVIEEESCMWVAEVTATHLEKDATFFVLVEGYDYFVIELRWRHKLAAWFAKHL